VTFVMLVLHKPKVELSLVPSVELKLVRSQAQEMTSQIQVSVETKIKKKKGMFRIEYKLRCIILQCLWHNFIFNKINNNNENRINTYLGQ